MPVKGAVTNAIKDRQGTPSAVEFARLIAHMRAKGLTLAAVQAVVGSGAGGRSRGAIAAALVAYLRGRPKG